MTKPRMLVADDHAIFAEALRSLLEEDFDIVAVVTDGEALVAETKKQRPDVVVTDITMPGLSGIDAFVQLRESGCCAKFVFLTMYADAGFAARAFDLGASGFVLKQSASSELIVAVREALKGRTYVAPTIAKQLMEMLRQGQSSPNPAADVLTSRQREVLALIARGHTAKEGASLLGISPRTVEFHKYRAMDALGLKSNADLVEFALRNGMLTPTDFERSA